MSTGTSCVVSLGTVTAVSGLVANFELRREPSFSEIEALQSGWFNYALGQVRAAQRRGASTGEIEELLARYAIEASWNWVSLKAYFSGPSYAWFLLYVQGDIEGVAIVKFPETGKLSGKAVFYIEYLAISPWNRTSTSADRVHSGLGRLLIERIQNYMHHCQGLTPGICLHSLPGAEAFYMRLGMQPEPLFDKVEGAGAVLAYFELSEQGSSKMLGGHVQC